jgi:hypothetical protein
MDVESALGTLTQEITRQLAAARSPHTKAVSRSAVHPEDVASGVFRGGGVVAPDKPPFDLENDRIDALHRKVYEVAGKGVIHSVIVHAWRANSKTKTWEARSRAVTMDEHDALAKARKPIDEEIERELRTIAASEPWEMMSFGKSTRQPAPRLSRRPPEAKLVRLEAPAALLELFTRAERVYQERNLELVVAFWTLENGKSKKIAFREYFE